MCDHEEVQRLKKFNQTKTIKAMNIFIAFLLCSVPNVIRNNRV